MKKFFSTRYSEFSFNISLFLLRVGVSGLLFINHGLPKLKRFAEMKDSFSDPLHIGSPASLILIIVAEAICSVLLVLGLLTRLAAFILTVAFIVIVFIVQKNKPLKDHELPALFLLAFLTVLFCGPGKWSLDKMIGK